MRAVNLTVRCMAWPEGGQWVAACVDLTLAAQAGSLQDAQKALNAQIVSYIREAVTVDKQHADELLSRRASLWDQIRFSFWIAVSNRPRLRRTVGKFIDRVGIAIRRKLAYSQPLPLYPA